MLIFLSTVLHKNVRTYFDCTLNHKGPVCTHMKVVVVLHSKGHGAPEAWRGLVARVGAALKVPFSLKFSIGEKFRSVRRRAEMSKLNSAKIA